MKSPDKSSGLFSLDEIRRIGADRCDQSTSNGIV